MNCKALKNVVSAVCLILAMDASAHGGRLDKDGCHNDHAVKSYHCNRAGSSKKNEVFQRALLVRQSTSAQTTNTKVIRPIIRLGFIRKNVAEPTLTRLSLSKMQMPAEHMHGTQKLSSFFQTTKRIMSNRALA